MDGLEARDCHRSRERFSRRVTPLGDTPIFFMMWGTKHFTVVARAEPHSIESLLAHFQSVWSKHLPTRPFEYTFLDDALAEGYRSEQRMNSVLIAGAAISVGIAVLA